MMTLDKYSIGIGDRFGQQGKAQLRAMVEAGKRGIDVVPVWNKSHREHTIIGSSPSDVRKEADSAVKALAWKLQYFVDADHIGLKNVDIFIGASDFFTLDVADFIGKKAERSEIESFEEKFGKYTGSLRINGMSSPLVISKELVVNCAEKYLFAVKEAGRIYRKIVEAKGEGNFVAEVSMDETSQPQTPVEIFFILAAIAAEGIPAQTVAPKFSGRFNKGVDYVGDVKCFAVEFEQNLAVLAFAGKEFGLPKNLKLSVHSGSDKFGIYGVMKNALAKFDAGLHLKTAGTTWLEEICGLAEAGGDGLEIAKAVYAKAYGRFDELCGPYETVIDIKRSALPSPDQVAGWKSEVFASAVRHDVGSKYFNSNFRQLLHVGYKVAAEMGDVYIKALTKHADIVGKNVTANLLERHILKVFPS